MRKISLNKKAFFVFLILSILLLAGFYFWAKNTIIGREIGFITKTIDVSEYEIKDIENGKIIENEKEGLIVKVPDGWTVKKNKENNQNEIILLDPNNEFDENGELIFKKSVLEKGACGIGLTIMKCEKKYPDISTEAEIIKGYIESVKSGELGGKSSFSLEYISGKESLKQIIEVEGRVTSINVQTPINNTIYGFGSAYIYNERCLEEFNKFLNNIIIK